MTVSLIASRAGPRYFRGHRAPGHWVSRTLAADAIGFGIDVDLSGSEIARWMSLVDSGAAVEGKGTPSNLISCMRSYPSFSSPLQGPWAEPKAEPNSLRRPPGPTVTLAGNGVGGIGLIDDQVIFLSTDAAQFSLNGDTDGVGNVDNSLGEGNILL